MKVLEDNPSNWPYIIEGILFARVSCHASTKYSPFKLMYNRDPVLPIDVKHNLPPCGEGQDPFDKETLDAALKIREAATDEVAENIKKAQKKQKQDFDRRHLSGPGIRVGDAVLLRNNRRNDRNGGCAVKWLGPYFVTSVSPKRVAMLKNRDGKILLKKYDIAQFKPHVDCEGSKSVCCGL